MIKRVLDIPQTAMDVFNMLPEGTRCEVIDNAIYMSPSLTTSHQKISGSIQARLFIAAEQKSLGEVFAAPCDVYLDEGRNVFQPDILFVKAERLEIIKESGVYGSPDLIIEILSANQAHDIIRKFDIYQRNLVPEYIIVDPATKEVWQYILRGDTYQQIPSQIGQLLIQQLDMVIEI